MDDRNPLNEYELAFMAVLEIVIVEMVKLGANSEELKARLEVLREHFQQGGRSNAAGVIQILMQLAHPRR